MSKPFRLHPLRFHFVANESIHFAQGKSANVLRGAFGTIFRRIACAPQCPGVRECDIRSSCPYARLFEPSLLAGGPSGLADWPRPFVFRAMHLDGVTFSPGSSFHFDLNLFGVDPPVLAYFVLTFAQLASEGLGPGRRKVDLVSAEQLDGSGQCSAIVYDKTRPTPLQSIPPLEVSLAPPGEPVARVQVQFVTPTELKSGHQIATRPEFGILAARIRDRISTLSALYGPGPLEIDFRAFGERANLIRMTRCGLRHVNSERRSSRTGQVHSVGGFVGEAEYEGDLTEFVPYLRVAKWTGVGRQTVWGKGEISS
jgi:hypothetical protein